MPKTKKKKPKYQLIGFIAFDLFNMQVPIFLSNKHRVKFLATLGIQEEDEPGSIVGLTARNTNSLGQPVFTMVLAEGSDLGTWSHEASHLVDFILDTFNIPTGVKNSELRACMMGHTVASIFLIMEAHVRSLSGTLLNGEKIPETVMFH